MFKKIEELHDHKTNEGFYPLTHVQAVIDNDEIDLETKLNQINNDISTKVTDYSKQYLTTVARENGTISFIISAGINTNLLTSMSYSTDGGNTWITTNNSDDNEENVQIDVNVHEGDKVMWKGIGLALSDGDNEAVSSFVTNIPIDVEGNIMSLLYGDNFIGQTALPDVGYNFYELFGNGINSGADVVDSSDLILAATTLVNDCYDSMFSGCTSLTHAPTLPATTLADSCYQCMFIGCTSLTQAPVLPAMTLAESCYYMMFKGCTSLMQAPTLPATTLATSCYAHMFDGCTSLTQSPALPAMILSDNCYVAMFKGCTSLTQAPALPATTLADSCYSNMFRDCTSLTQAPALPAMALANNCYTSIFYHCTSLTQAPALPATTLAGYCYRNMFWGCISLTQAPELPATILGTQCYSNMFSGCTSLTQTPELPATTLAYGCYEGMFISCTSLTQAPSLPATTLANYCYYDMFSGCTSLTQSPALPAMTLTERCYSRMFNGCTNLSSVICLATDISASNSTTNWLSGVAATGTFGKAESMTSWTNGISGIPNGWTVVDCIATTPTRYLTFKAETDNSSFGLKTIATNHKIYYSRDLQYWKLFDTTEDVAINDGEEVYVIGDSDAVSSFGPNNKTTFRMAGSISVTGDITSILDYKTLNPKIAPYCYNGMFSGCTSLTQAPTLPATTLAGACYYRMFYGCTSLTQAPTLPATILANNCYYDMFSGCTSLTQAPALPATKLAYSCYDAMFSGCTSLTQPPTLPATRLTGGCYANMFYGCTSLTQAPALPATALAGYCYANMFQGCTSLTQAPALPAITLDSQCYQSMFKGCTSLTQSPELPANTLMEYCYWNMFNGCTNLSFVICLATALASNSTYDWLDMVASTGTFIIPDNSPAWSRNANGIPSGWNVYTKSGYEVVRHQELYSNISITPFINKQQKINNKSINQILIPIDSSKNNYSGDNLSDTTIITYISDTENYLVLGLDNVIEENYIIIEANLIGQGFYSNANILYNNGVVQIYSALPLNSIKDNLEYLFISYYISDTSGCGCGCGTTPVSTPMPDPTPSSSL